MRFHFISGLPRSGSTLLASILNQNPAFRAGITSPMGPTVTAARGAMSPTQETHVMWNGNQQAAVVRGIFDAYYKNVVPAFWEMDGTAVTFDTNRRWCADSALLAHIFPACRIICCVRDPREIVVSFEKYFRKYPVAMGVICRNNQSTTIFDRLPILMASDGVVGYAYKAFRDAWFGPEKSRLHVIEYEQLVDDPANELMYLHRELGLPDFDYDFDNIQPIPRAAEFDTSIGSPGLHNLRPRVQAETDDNHPLPPEVLDQIPAPFWR